MMDAQRYPDDFDGIVAGAPAFSWPDDAVSDHCFTQDQLNAVKTVYAKVANESGTIYPGYPYGGENELGGWFGWVIGPEGRVEESGFPSAQYGFGTEIFKYLVFQDSTWDYSKYGFSDYFEETRHASAYLDATSADYSGFKKRNGKLIIYHGWNDLALSALSTIDHYEAVEKKDPEVREYFRLFMLPGVLHCGGGPGPAQTDWIELIRDWVENDTPPERVIVRKMKDGEVIMTRPVFPYPRKAVYDGKGDPNKECSFK